MTLPVWNVPLLTAPKVMYASIGVHNWNPRVQRWPKFRYWGVHFYKYAATMWGDGVEMEIRPGCVSVMPAHVDLEYHFRGPSEQACVHLDFPQNAQGRIPIPAMQDLGDDFDALFEQMERAVVCYPTQPQRSVVRVWDILWTLSERAQPPSARHQPTGGGAPHRAVTLARQMIEQMLQQSIDIPHLADTVGISHNHLTRLFQQEFKMTIVGYIRSRRVERARHLLMNSTLPIKAIAREVGIPDPHLFNKIIRRELGKAPRDVRKTLAAREND